MNYDCTCREIDKKLSQNTTRKIYSRVSSYTLFLTCVLPRHTLVGIKSIASTTINPDDNNKNNNDDLQYTYKSYWKFTTDLDEFHSVIEVLVVGRHVHVHRVQDAERVGHRLVFPLVMMAAEAEVMVRAHEETADLADGRFVGDRRAGNHVRAEHVELWLDHRRRRHLGGHVHRPLVLLVFGYRLQGGARSAAVQQRVWAVRGQAVRRLVLVLRQ